MRISILSLAGLVCAIHLVPRCTEASDEPAQHQSQQPGTSIVATGIGIDPDKALRNAFMNAVEQTVGLIVDSETLVKNENVVKDDILTFSDGFVETFQKLKEGKREDGLFEIRIAAVIKRRQLIERLKQSKVVTAKIDGQSLFGELATQHEAETNGARLLAKVLDGSLVSLLTASIIQPKPAILEKTDASVKASWNIEVSFNWDEYATNLLPRLKGTLESISRRKASSEISDEGEWIANNGPVWSSHAPGSAIQPSEAPGILTPSKRRPFWREVTYAPTPGAGFVNSVNMVARDPEKELLILLNVGRSQDLHSRRWRWYVLDSATTAPVLKPLLSQALIVRIAILDSENQVVRQSDIPLNNSAAEFLSFDAGQPVKTAIRSEQDWFISNCFRAHSSALTFQIAPYMRLHGSIYGDTLELVYTTELTWDEVKRVSAIRCSVVIPSP